MPVFRNPCATNPLLRKGGVHIRSKTGQRSRDHYDLLDEADQFMDEYSENRMSDIKGKEEKREPEAPFFNATIRV